MNEIIRIMKSVYTDGFLSTMIISLVLALVSSVFFMFAVSEDSKLNNIKNRNLWISFVFFFGYIGAAIYFVSRQWLKQEVPIVCSSCGKKPPKGRKKCPYCGGTHFSPRIIENRGAVKNRVAVFLAVAIVVTGFNYWFTNYSEWAIDSENIANEEVLGTDSDFHYGYEVGGSTVYYDMKGNEYTDAYEVLYYDKDGNAYEYDSVKGFVSGDNSISEDMALVDSNGYIIDTAKQFDVIPENVPFQTQDGTKYYYAKDVSWNSDGEMVYSSNGNIIN